MMIADQYPGLLDRPDEEKLQLAGELWRAVIGQNGEGDDPSLIHLMETRLSEFQSYPDQVASWDEVKARLMALRR
jgi:hypothetical protein